MTTPAGLFGPAVTSIDVGAAGAVASMTMAPWLVTLLDCVPRWSVIHAVTSIGPSARFEASITETTPSAADPVWMVGAVVTSRSDR